MDAEHARALLAAKRREIEQSLGRRAHEDDGDEAGWLEPGNLAANLYLDELDESFGDDLRERLAAVERAEERLAKGTYGLSVLSGTRIPDERLEVEPATELTVDEERREEGRRR